MAVCTLCDMTIFLFTIWKITDDRISFDGFIVSLGNWAVFICKVGIYAGWLADLKYGFTGKHVLRIDLICLHDEFELGL